MEYRKIRVLIIEDNPGDAGLIREALGEVKTATFEVEHAKRLSDGLASLEEMGADVILLDLTLPDSQGLDTFFKVHAQVPDIPIVVMTGINDEFLAVTAVQEGAQDYLVKGEAYGSLLGRAIRYAVERHKMRAALEAMSLMDELTGLYNRRGLMTLGSHQIKVADRTKKDIFMLYADLDRMKEINDTFGHPAGDEALTEVAKILRDTFRDSDVVARIGGDEFAVVAVETHHTKADTFTSRLEENLRERNARGDLRYTLSLSVGIARHREGSPVSVEDLLSKSDAEMYRQKRQR